MPFPAPCHLRSDKFNVKPQHVGLLWRTIPLPAGSPLLPAVAVAVHRQQGPGLPAGRSTDRRHTRAPGYHLDVQVLRTVQLTCQRAGWLRTRLRGYLGESFMRAENSITAPSRATLAGHRPMPCYGAVNASVTTDQAAPVGPAQGIRTLAGSMCTQCIRQARGRPAKESHRGANWPASDQRQAFVESNAPVRVLGSYPKPLLHALPSDSLSRAKSYRAAATLVD